MTSLSLYKGAMTPARACYRSPLVVSKVGEVSLEILRWQSVLGVLLRHSTAAFPRRAG